MTSRSKKPVKQPPTPRQLLLDRFHTQTAIAEAAGSTRQAVSIAFKRGRLSFEMASVLSKRMRIKIALLLTEWIPDTNRRSKQSAHSKRRMRVVEERL